MIQWQKTTCIQEIRNKLRIFNTKTLNFSSEIKKLLVQGAYPSLYNGYCKAPSKVPRQRCHNAASPLGGKTSRQKNFRQSNWLIEFSPRNNVEPRIVGIRSTFRGSTFFHLVEIRLRSRETVSWIAKLVKIPGYTFSNFLSSQKGILRVYCLAILVHFRLGNGMLLGNFGQRKVKIQSFL